MTSKTRDAIIIKSYLVSYLSIKFPRYDGSSSDQFWRSLIAFRLSQLLIKRLAVAMLNWLLFSQWNSSKFSKLFINKIFLIESSFTAVRPPKSIFLRVEPEHWAIFYIKYKAILFKKSNLIDKHIDSYYLDRIIT